VIQSIWTPAAHLPCRVGADNRGERGERNGGGNGRGAARATAAAMPCLAGGIAGLRGLRHMRAKGIAGAAAGTSAGGTRDAAGALDAGWTLWMWQNCAPRLAVNVYNRYLISSRDKYKGSSSLISCEKQTIRIEF
jgi:hypothetical protein